MLLRLTQLSNSIYFFIQQRNKNSQAQANQMAPQNKATSTGDTIKNTSTGDSIKKPNLNGNNGNNTEILAIALTCAILFLFFFLIGFITWWRARNNVQKQHNVQKQPKNTSKSIPASKTSKSIPASKTSNSIPASISAIQDSFMEMTASTSLALSSFFNKYNRDDPPPHYESAIQSPQTAYESAIQSPQTAPQGPTKKVSRKEIDDYFSKPLGTEERPLSRLTPPSKAAASEGARIFNNQEEEVKYPSRSRYQRNELAAANTMDGRKGATGGISPLERPAYFTEGRFKKATITRRPLEDKASPERSGRVATRERRPSGGKGLSRSSSRSRSRQLGPLPQRQDSVKTDQGFQLPDNSTMPMNDLYPKPKSSFENVVEYYDGGTQNEKQEHLEDDLSHYFSNRSSEIQQQPYPSFLDESPSTGLPLPTSQSIPSLSRVGMLDSIKSASLRRAQKKL